jgi:hypothetical protein
MALGKPFHLSLVYFLPHYVGEPRVSAGHLIYTIDHKSRSPPDSVPTVAKRLAYETVKDEYIFV